MKLSSVKTLAVFTILSISIFLGVGADAHAAGCKMIKAKGNSYYHIKAQLHQYTHIELPERFMGAPLTGNDSLWDPDGQGNHVMIKPNSTEPEGKKTTLTVIGAETNKAYKFIVTRVNAKADTCVIVKEGNISAFKNDEIANWRSPKEREIMALEQGMVELQRQLQQEQAISAKRAEQALIKYRTYIYTRYNWDKGTGFMGKDLICDVYDDGRFTYIRFQQGNRGLLAVTAEVDDKMEMVESKLDSENIYKIAGIYPKFILKYGKSKVTVKRKDNLSNGVY